MNAHIYAYEGLVGSLSSERAAESFLIGGIPFEVTLQNTRFGILLCFCLLPLQKFFGRNSLSKLVKFVHFRVWRGLRILGNHSLLHVPDWKIMMTWGESSEAVPNMKVVDTAAAVAVFFFLLSIPVSNGEIQTDLLIHLIHSFIFLIQFCMSRITPALCKPTWYSSFGDKHQCIFADNTWKLINYYNSGQIIGCHFVGLGGLYYLLDRFRGQGHILWE